jgi:hypothetical protein
VQLPVTANLSRTCGYLQVLFRQKPSLHSPVNLHGPPRSESANANDARIDSAKAANTIASEFFINIPQTAYIGQTIINYF